MFRGYRKTWCDPIRSNVPPIKIINKTLETYKTAYLKGEHTKEQLKNIIDVCEMFLRSVLRRDRSASHLFKIVLEIQKKAVARWLLPDAKNDALARWKVIRHLMISDATPKKFPKKFKGITLDKEYWLECTFQGYDMVPDWIEDDFSQSFAEIIQMVKPIEYVKNPDECKVLIENGLLTFNGELLSTQNSHNNHQKLHGAVIYVADLDGSLYISDPKQDPTRLISHSSLLRGKKILCAGVLAAQDGLITWIDDDSGHYKPTKQQFSIFMKVLNEKICASSLPIVSAAEFQPEDLLRDARCVVQ